MKPTPPTLKFLKALNRVLQSLRSRWQNVACWVRACANIQLMTSDHNPEFTTDSACFCSIDVGILTSTLVWWMKGQRGRGRSAAGRLASAPGGMWVRRDRPRQRRTVRSSWTSRDSPPWQRGSTYRTPPVRETGEHSLWEGIVHIHQQKWKQNSNRFSSVG